MKPPSLPADTFAPTDGAAAEATAYTVLSDPIDASSLAARLDALATGGAGASGRASSRSDTLDQPARSEGSNVSIEPLAAAPSAHHGRPLPSSAMTQPAHTSSAPGQVCMRGWYVYCCSRIVDSMACMCSDTGHL